MEGDEGNAIGYQNVPTIGGTDGIPSTAPVVQSTHLGDLDRAEGVMYPETPGVGGPDGHGYPGGTVFPHGGINDAPGPH